MIELRDYQIENAAKGAEILRSLIIVYLAMEVRTGKTLTSLEIARQYGAKNVLFATKKKGISSIENDYHLLNPGYKLTVVNDESLHKVDDDFDLIIHDEHHRFAAFPKPGATAKLFKAKYGHLPMIFLSGTPCPEGYSQIYHQFWVSRHSPFSEPSFYKWAHNFVNVTQRNHGYGLVNDYSAAKLNLIAPIIEPYMIRKSQADAGFVSTIDERIIWCLPSDRTINLADTLVKDRVIVGKENTITADTAVALQSKLHQIYSGTILFDEEVGKPRKSMTLDTFKADEIKRQFRNMKIVIFYKFAAESELLLDVLGQSITTDIDEFQATDKSIALQFVSGRECLNLSKAEAIVFYNIDFAALSYWQTRDRMTTRERTESKVYWLFAKGGIEPKIYDAVKEKKNYTLNMFKKDFGIGNTKPAYQKV